MHSFYYDHSLYLTGISPPLIVPCNMQDLATIGIRKNATQYKHIIQLCMKNCTTDVRCKTCILRAQIFDKVTGVCRPCIIRVFSCMIINCAATCLNTTSNLRCEYCAKSLDCSLGDCVNPNYAHRQQEIFFSG